MCTVIIRNGMMGLRIKFCAEAAHPRLLLSNPTLVEPQQSRSVSNRHRIPKWKRQRREKYLKTPLPAFEEMRKLLSDKLTPAEIRAFMRQQGAIPYVRGSPAIVVTSSSEVFDEYVPTEGEGVLSGLTDVTKLHKPMSKARQKREVQKFEEDFVPGAFAEQALDIYKEVHNLLPKVFPRNFLSDYRDDHDFYRLHDLVTEFAWPALTNGLEDKTLVWKFVESLEPAKVVHYYTQDLHKKGNKFGQITVRFHSQQIMALYDRFGRLMYGSETVPKDTLDFIVFEKHLSDTLGKWKLHSKLRPSWQTTNQPSPKRTVLTTEDSESVSVTTT